MVRWHKHFDSLSRRQQKRRIDAAVNIKVQREVDRHLNIIEQIRRENDINTNNTSPPHSIDIEMEIEHDLENCNLNSQENDNYQFENDSIINEGNIEYNSTFTKEETLEERFLKELRIWIFSSRISQSIVGRLLKVLKSLPQMNFLPKDPRTLLGTLKLKNLSTPMGKGKFWYLGLEKCLTTILEIPQVELPEKTEFRII